MLARQRMRYLVRIVFDAAVLAVSLAAIAAAMIVAGEG